MYAQLPMTCEVFFGFTDAQVCCIGRSESCYCAWQNLSLNQSKSLWTRWTQSGAAVYWSSWVHCRLCVVRWKVVQIVAHLRPQVSFPSSPMKQLPPLLGMVGVAIALPPPTITELVIDNDMFVTRLSPQLKVTYCEPRFVRRYAVFCLKCLNIDAITASLEWTKFYWIGFGQDLSPVHTTRSNGPVRTGSVYRHLLCIAFCFSFPLHFILWLSSAKWPPFNQIYGFNLFTPTVVILVQL